MRHKGYKDVRSLTRSTMFWVWLVCPVVTGLVLMWSAGADMVWDWSPDGFNYWAKSFAVPLTIMGLSGPLTAIYVAHHRSTHQETLYRVQTEENRRSNYYDTFKEFESLYKEFKSDLTTNNSEFESALPTARFLFSQVWDRSMGYELSLSSKVINLKNEALSIARYTSGLSPDKIYDDASPFKKIALENIKNYISCFCHIGVPIHSINQDISVYGALIASTEINRFLSDHITFVTGIPFPKGPEVFGPSVARICVSFELTSVPLSRLKM
ncbi:hypothetical protein [Dasania marina]|uniref:hypothetical protein n=1 Tax=Dasania marina TaxID=471499 RepID=UPI0004AFC21F|nr:hypothetical protein [Dasania marina]